MPSEREDKGTAPVPSSVRAFSTYSCGPPLHPRDVARSPPLPEVAPGLEEAQALQPPQLAQVQGAVLERVTVTWGCNL